MIQTTTSAASRTAPGSGAAPTGEPIVVVQRLVKTFRDFWMRSRARAVNDVTFEIRRGEIFGLLGPNGSGKSTTIKVLLGLLHKTSGAVSVFGKLPSDVDVKRRIGYLPEESYLYPFLNARETLDYYAKLFNLERSTRKRRIDELLDMVGLTAVQHRQVREYSKGMQRRIGLAQALINDPELLILDEPTTGLDPIGTRQVKDLIIDLGRRGKTVLLSSHLLSDVEDCVDRMVILYGGKVQREGTCDELLDEQDRTIIETEALDDATIAQIDALIRQRSGGDKSIGRVSHPRQKLEELFVDIVRQARASNQETAGAQHGGQTASFLRSEEAAVAGEDLVASLVAAGTQKAQGVEAAPPVSPSAAAGRSDRGNSAEADADLAMLSNLLDRPGQVGPNAAAESTERNLRRHTPGADMGRAQSPAGAGALPKQVKPDADLGVIGSLLGDEAGGEGSGARLREDRGQPGRGPGAGSGSGTGSEPHP